MATEDLCRLCTIVVEKDWNINFQEHDFLLDLKIPPFHPCYLAAEKKAGISNPVKNRVLERCSNIFHSSSCMLDSHKLIKAESQLKTQTNEGLTPRMLLK